MALHQIAALAVLVALAFAVDAAVKLVRLRRRGLAPERARQARRLAVALASFLALALLFIALDPGRAGGA